MNAKTKKKTASISVPADVLAAAQCLIYEFLSNDFDDRMKEFRDTGLCRASGTGADELEAAAECYERWRLIREAKLESKAGLTSLKQWRLEPAETVGATQVEKHRARRSSRIEGD